MLRNSVNYAIVIRQNIQSAFLLLLAGLGTEGIIMGLAIGDGMTFLILLWPLRHRVMGAIGTIRQYVSFGSQTLQILAINLDYYLVLGLF
jgi:hypothetical protein